MAADLTAKFQLIDEMSSKFSAIADAGNNMLDNFEQAGDQMGSTFDDVSGYADTAVKSVDGVATSLNDVNNTAENASNTTNDLSNSIDALTQANDQAADSMDDLRKSSEEAAKGFEDTREQYEKTREESERTRKESEKTKQSGVDAITTLNSLLAASGIASAIGEIADSFMAASESAAHFETAITKISTIADTSVMSLDSIQSQISSLSKETGESVTDLSEAVYSALSASVDTANAVEFTATATKLAAGGFTSSATAVDVLTTALNAYGLEASEAEQISDYLITTQNLGKTTVDELAASVGKVIPLASAYGVEMDNLSAAYAELTKGGIATAESGTYLKSMLNELGDSTSTVTATLEEMTGLNFAGLMEQGYSLGDVMEVLGEAVDGDAGAFNELWSSSEAGIGALSLYNAGAEQFNATLEAMQTSAGATETAFATMTDTTEHAEQEMSNAATNLQNSIGAVLNPTMESIYDTGTNLLNLASDIVEEHPGIVKAATAVAAGLGTVVAGVTGVVTVMGLAKPLIAAFGTTLSAALGPITAVAVGITAVTAAVTILKGNYDEAYDSTVAMTAVTRSQTDQLEELQTEYDKACETFGEMSDEASELKYQINDLSAELEKNGQSVAELVSEIDNLISEHDQLINKYSDTAESVNNEQVENLALIAKLEDLASVTDQTAGSQEAMQQIINQLNGNIDGLNLSYEDLINNQNATVESVKAAAQAQAEQERQAAKWQEYVDLLGQAADEEEELVKVNDEVAAAQERAAAANDDYMERYNLLTANGTNAFGGIAMMWSDEKATLDAAADALGDVTAAQQELQSASEETADRIAELEKELGTTTDTTSDLTEETLTYEDAAGKAYQNIQSQVEALCESYDKAYQSALDSFEGQFGLFDEASEKSEEYMSSTVENAQKALDSQLKYWEDYNANLETLTEYGNSLSDEARENYEELLQYASDGSEQAAGLAASMASAIESGDEAAIEKLAQTVQDVAAKQEEAAATTADFTTEFSTKMDELVQKAETSIDSMNLSDEATAAAKETLESYAEQISISGDNAVIAAQSVANRVAAALSGSGNVGYASGTTNSTANFITGEEGPELVVAKAASHANGTLDGENFYMAGENGPELIVGEPGSEVFPTSETDRLIDALNYQQNNFTSKTASRPALYIANEPQPEKASQPSGASSSMSESMKRIVLEIAGSGSIDVGGGVDKDTVVNLMWDNIKPILMSILQTEIYEEGDLSYEY